MIISFQEYSKIKISGHKGQFLENTNREKFPFRRFQYMNKLVNVDDFLI